MTAEQKATAKKALGITVQIAALLVITLQYAKSFSTPAMSAIRSCLRTSKGCPRLWLL